MVDENKVNEDLSKNVEGPKSTIMIDNKEYDLNSMTPNQQRIIAHLTDLTNKSEQMRFQLEQIEFSKDAFVLELKKLIKIEKVLKEEDN